MSSFLEKSRIPLILGAGVLLSSFTCISASAQQLPNFENEGKGITNYPEPNRRMVVLPSGVAAITAQKFALPKDTFQYPLAGMTMFPYYQASPELKEFLNNARVMNIPITSLRATPNLPTPMLPATDTTPIHIPLSVYRKDKHRSQQLALHHNKHDQSNWMVAHLQGQSFAVPGDPSALVMVSPGTMFNACGPRAMQLRCGTMWVLSGNRPIVVLTKYGAVQVKPNSIAAVEQSWFNRVKAVSLYGDELEVQLSYKNDKSKLALSRQKELTISESKLASSGVSDFVSSANSKLNAANAQQVPLESANLKLHTRNLDPDASRFVQELKAVNPPITDLRMSNAYKCMLSSFGISEDARQDEIRKRILQAEISTAKPTSFKASLDSRYFVPAYKHVKDRAAVPFPLVVEDLKSLWVQNGAVKYLEGSQIEVEHDGCIALNTGEAIFVAKDPMRLRINDCLINIQDGAIVHVLAKKDLTVIRNLKELASNSISARIKGRSIECKAGSELIIGRTVPAVFSQMKHDGITRRNVRSIETASGTVIINKSEIELTSLMQYDPLMRKVIESKDSFDKKVVAQVLKMDAVLSLVTDHRGTYSRMAGLPATR